MTPKQAAYVYGPKGQLQRQAHALQMTVVFRQKRPSPASCADCRKSQCERTGTGWEFVCTLKRALTPQTCSEFVDARRPTWEGPFPA